MLDLLLVAAGAIMLFLAAMLGMRAHQIAQAGETQLARVRATMEEVQRSLTDGGLKLEKLRLESAGMDQLSKEAQEELARVEAEVKKLTERKLSRIYLPSGPVDFALPNWLVEVSAKTEDPKQVAQLMEQLPFVGLPQRLVVNAESEPKAANLVAKRYSDLRLRVRVLGPWGVPVDGAPAAPASPAAGTSEA